MSSSSSSSSSSLSSSPSPGSNQMEAARTLREAAGEAVKRLRRKVAARTGSVFRKTVRMVPYAMQRQDSGRSGGGSSSKSVSHKQPWLSYRLAKLAAGLRAGEQQEIHIARDVGGPWLAARASHTYAAPEQIPTSSQLDAPTQSRKVRLRLVARQARLARATTTRATTTTATTTTTGKTIDDEDDDDDDDDNDRAANQIGEVLLQDQGAARGGSDKTGLPGPGHGSLVARRLAVQGISSGLNGPGLWAMVVEGGRGWSRVDSGRDNSIVCCD
ncbi:hypothetical protein K490DRAFT_58160 [Saccharata proteae CBS 121410]|uniref:Uncharacterized protein n=1 Tax=Saccharata proteae CBS 121410 TaxID=1314787 RepID=A0A9P4HUJ8_9PEZI|nr:hypothetical protein K490DRAFT_58160 [Saccharata proteae CBS 121410]